MTILGKIRRKLLHFRLQPVRVICFHHVSHSFDESTMLHGDWLPTDVFKQKVNKLRKEGYWFISLPEAYDKLKHDKFRFHKYAVLTADDGWASLRNILSWLNDQQIPVTLFLNPAYLDGKHFREIETEKYLSEQEVQDLYTQYPLVTIGSHGWEHNDATRMTMNEFIESVNKSVDYLKKNPNFIPFYAYPYGRHNDSTDNVLRKMNLIPVLVGGTMNYNNIYYIDRIAIDQKYESNI